jgi:hypothetical protein
MHVSKINTTILTFVVLLLCAAAAFAQGADDNNPYSTKRDPDTPKSFREMMQKMRIDQEKKDYEEMLDRGEQAAKISEQLEESFVKSSTLARTDREKLDDLEKLVKKIRGELGGDDDNGEDADSPANDDPAPKSAADGLKALQSLTGKLVDELKKTSRFGISAVAIQSSNAVLKVVRFLKFSK